MKLSNKINSKTILMPLKSSDKKHVLQELLNHFTTLDYLRSTVKLFSYLDKKEKIINSASGRGVAYHYHTSIEINDMIGVLGISKKGINYNAPDGILCNFILLILEPKAKEEQHRKFINYFQNLISNLSIKEQLLDTKNTQDIENIIKDWEKTLFSENKLI